MSFTLTRDPETSESLQCLACAGLQEIGNTFNADDLRQLMIQGKFKKTAHPDNDAVWDRVKITNIAVKNLAAWGHDPSDENGLNTWLDSSVEIAKALAGDSNFKGKGYVFYRQDQFPAGEFKDFKDVFVQILKSMRKSAQQPDAKKWFQGSSAKITEVKYVLIENQYSQMYKNVNFQDCHNFLLEKNFKLLKKFRFPTLHYEDRLYVNAKFEN